MGAIKHHFHDEIVAGQMTAKMKKHRKILYFIKLIRESHPVQERVFLNGSCLNFFLILRAVFLEAEPYFNIDHIITKIGDRYYDITGEVEATWDYVRYVDCYSKKGLIRSFRQMYRAEADLKPIPPKNQIEKF